MDATGIRPWSLLGCRCRPADAMADLMAGYQAGDALAFCELHAALRPALAAYLLSLGAGPAHLDSLLDRVFLEVHGARRSWHPGSAVEPWAQAIAGRVWRDAKRRPPFPAARA